MERLESRCVYTGESSNFLDSSEGQRGDLENDGKRTWTTEQNKTQKNRISGTYTERDISFTPKINRWEDKKNKMSGLKLDKVDPEYQG